jgi:hypothetical protein
VILQGITDQHCFAAVLTRSISHFHTALVGTAKGRPEEKLRRPLLLRSLDLTIWILPNGID